MHTTGPEPGGWAEIRARDVVAEDQAILALSKPPGISVTGERHGTDLVRLAAGAGERLFPVHRIDKATSGLILFAKELRWHGGLTRQFARGTAGKSYLAITRSTGLPSRGRIDLPLSTGRKNRVRVAAPRASIIADERAGTWSADPGAVFTHVPTYPSVTTFETLWSDDQHSLLVVHPVTGRRHQIRVHLAWIGHPIEGDPLFAAAAAPRAYLHSWRLEITAAWRGGARLRLAAPPGGGFWVPLAPALSGEEAAALLDRA